MTKYFSQNPNGQTTMANSQPIVIASDQSEVPVNLPDVTSTDGATAPAQALVISGVTSGGVAQTVEVNASGHINVADGGGSLTVDGTVAVTQATAANLNATVVGTGTFATQSAAVDATASGNITTQNLVPAGTATAGSAVEISLAGHGEATVQVTGTYTGALSLQYTVDGSTWITNSSGTFTNVNSGAVATTIASAATGIFQFDVGGMQKARITGLAAMTGTAAITIRASRSSGFVAIDAPIPTGTNTIGAVNIAAAQTLATVTTVGTVTTVSTVTTNNNNIPNAITDVASAAITTTTTTAAFTPTSGSSYSVVIPVTAVSGTTPTMAVAIEESDDSGTNWYNRYTFPTISATGTYRSPILKLRGNRVRYVQTLTGTTPSFTRSVLRLQRQFIDFASVPGKLISAASTNATSVKPTPCEVTSISVANINAAARYLKIYDKASAPTVGTDTPIQTFLIPGATTGSGSNLQLNTPINFNLGFAFALTTGIADSDTGAVAANEIIVNYNVA